MGQKKSNFIFYFFFICWIYINISGNWGGMLISPFLIYMNILPEVISATNSVSTFFSSFISSIQYINSGKLLPIYSLIFFILSGISSYIGLKLSFYIIKKFKRRSYIIFILALIILISTILLTIISINKIITGKNNNNFMNFCKLN